MHVKDHYDQHLGKIYSWMTGDFPTRCSEFRSFLEVQQLVPKLNGIAVDLGSGHGIQSIPLAELGFEVYALDFNEQLLSELKENAGELPIHPVPVDFTRAEIHHYQPELIACCGDTLSHLSDAAQLHTFLEGLVKALPPMGKLLLSFRDYSIPRTGTDRILPVKSDENRILTCILDYHDDFVEVTDLLHEKTTTGWTQHASSYTKIRLRTTEILNILKANGMEINYHEVNKGLTTLIATKNF